MSGGREGVTIVEEWTNFETILKTAADSNGRIKRDIRNG
jgi:hypothetical protein